MTKEKQMLLNVARLLGVVASILLAVASVRSAMAQRAVIQNNSAQSRLRAVNEQNHDLMEENNALREAIRTVSTSQ